MPTPIVTGGASPTASSDRATTDGRGRTRSADHPAARSATRPTAAIAAEHHRDHERADDERHRVEVHARDRARRGRRRRRASAARRATRPRTATTTPAATASSNGPAIASARRGRDMPEVAHRGLAGGEQRDLPADDERRAR